MGTNERREREKQKRREDILEAARAIFFEKGFYQSTMDDIARSTELARGTLYLYFENKEEVYALVLEEGLTILHGLIFKSYSPLSDPVTNLLNGHDAFMAFHDDYPQYYKVLTIDKMEFAEKISEEIKHRLDEKFAHMVQWIAKILADGVAQGMFRPMPLQEVALLQIGLAMGYAQMVDKCAECSSIPVDLMALRQAQHDLIANGVMMRQKI